MADIKTMQFHMDSFLTSETKTFHNVVFAWLRNTIMGRKSKTLEEIYLETGISRRQLNQYVSTSSPSTDMINRLGAPYGYQVVFNKNADYTKILSAKILQNNKDFIILRNPFPDKVRLKKNKVKI